jgi:SAM-dependent methyltransferase
MGFPASIRGMVQRAFNSVGLSLSRYQPSVVTAPVATTVFETLGPQEPLIVDQAEYERLWYQYKEHPLSAHSGSVWNPGQDHTSSVQDISPVRFRADNDFIYQTRAHSAASYVVEALWVEKSDTYGLLNRTREAGDFGVECIRMDGRLWSRDLMDSVLEITFLLDNLPPQSLDTMRIVDIGAGYGRLLHRLADVTDNPHLLGADGFALSTAICRAYIRHRGLASRVTVLDLAGVNALTEHVDLATNVHSFSEMPLAAVTWWLDWLVRREAKYLFIVPNRPGPALNDGTDLMPALKDRGFSLVAHRMKYVDLLVGENALYQANYYLFIRA